MRLLQQQKQIPPLCESWRKIIGPNPYCSWRLYPPLLGQFYLQMPRQNSSLLYDLLGASNSQQPLGPKPTTHNRRLRIEGDYVVRKPMTVFEHMIVRSYSSSTMRTYTIIGDPTHSQVNPCREEIP
ncbi:hypothetical protein EPI10_031039 [Gossypium australe]|uniref:Uncharacterized protein n=1 Tax=Gossypium australe TaxID=47621 RepID=A0A5B6WZ60_9ROSI|nr:hypothetical protein EPI10_031039 [Gossypium australe]